MVYVVIPTSVSCSYLYDAALLLIFSCKWPRMLFVSEYVAEAFTVLHFVICRIMAVFCRLKVKE